MIEGSPLRYHYDHNTSPNKSPGRQNQEQVQDILFRPYLQLQHNSDYYPYSTYSSSLTATNMSEDMLMVPQLSDSEGSVSSASESPKPMKSLKCCWRNCGIDFDSLDQLASHVSKVHGASGPGGLFYCGWEGCTRNERAFNARYKMLVHVRTHTNEKPHQCYQCDKSFSRAENLKIHIRSHSGEKPYVCPVAGCNKAYSNSSDRFKHTRTHQVDKPYQCKVPGCSKRYTDPSSLRKHVKTYKHFVIENVKNDCICNCKRKHECEHNVVLPFRGYNELNLNDNFQNYKDHEFNWSGIIGSKIFAPYNMDIEAPLDLSISGKSS